MIRTRASRLVSTISILALAVALGATVVGCNSSKPPGTTPAPVKAAPTAKAGLEAATSALSTTAPEAKLLVVQTANSVTPTSPPVWSYLFGSPKDDKTYMVYIKGGKLAEPPTEYGTAGLKKDEWAVVPNTDAWKIDSDVAYKTAQEASGAKSEGAYTMGFITHVPTSDKTSTTEAFIWYISFDQASGASTGTVQVDAKTGAVVAK